MQHRPAERPRISFRFVLGLAIVGISTTLTWLYRRRVLPSISTTELEVSMAGSAPEPIPPEAEYGEAPIQLLTSGAGPLYVRSYQADIENPAVGREALFQRIIEDINHYSPPEMAWFERTKGEEGQLAVGDEFFIHITGPWNGPVRVIDVAPTSFSFATLEGHLEAGQITFSILELSNRQDAIRFRIQSWARSSNRVTDFFYRVLGLSKFAQTVMWTFFVEQVIAESAGKRIGDLSVMTHQVNAQQAIAQLPAWKRYSQDFERWRGIDLNFDINKTEEYTSAYGWHVDDYSIGLPGETRGEPIPNGSFEAAKDILLNYKFPDPSIITGVFVPDEPLKDRILVLRGRFLIFRFLFGVRIGKVVDELRETDKQGPIRVWGYSYRTLKGHFEMGEILFEVQKELANGDVRFNIHAYSKTDRIPNPFYRIGFAVFGRSLQVRFARTALTRMQQLVLEQIATAQNKPIEKPVEQPDVQPLHTDEAAQTEAETTRATPGTESPEQTTSG